MYQMPAKRFVHFAERLAAYAGVLQARVLAEKEGDYVDGQKVNRVAPTREAIQGNSDLAGVVEF